MNPRQITPPKTPDDFTVFSSHQPMQISRNTHLDRLYNVKSPDPPPPPPLQPMDTRKPSIPNYQNDLIIPTNGKSKPITSPATVTPREKIDGSTKLSLEDVRRYVC